MAKPASPASWTRPAGKGPRLELRLHALAGLFTSLASALGEFAGPELADRLAVRPAYDVGRRQGGQYAQTFHIEGRNAISSAAPAVIAVETYNAKYEVPRAQRDDFQMRIVQCPLKEAVAELGVGAARAGCNACGEYMKGLVHGVNPEAEVQMPERMGWGDAACRLEVKVRALRPGPNRFDVPDEVKFMSDTMRREFLIEAFTGLLTQATRGARAVVPADLATRVMSHAAYPAGIHDGRRARELFHITGKDLGKAGLTANALSDVLEVDYDVVESEPDRYVWRGRNCPFVDLKTVEKGSEAASFICEACKNYNEGLLHSVSEEFSMEIDKRLAAGDPYCEFRAERIPVRRRVRRPSRGWVDLGLSRVALLQSDSVFYYLWKLLGETMGEVGKRAAADLIERDLRSKAVTKDEAGFRRAVEALIDAGFGDFQVIAVDLGAPHAEVQLTNGVEAYAALHHGEKDGAACHLTAGLLAGIVQELSGIRNLTCEEAACAARGAPRCRFLVRRAT